MVIDNGLLNGLVSYWPLDEGGGAGTFEDVHGPNDLTEGGTLVTVSGAVINDGLQETSGDGTNRASIADGTQVGLDTETTSFSIAGWLRMDGDDAGFGVLANKGDNTSGGNNRTYQVGINGDTGDTNNAYFDTIHTDAVTVRTLTGSTELADDTWYHLVATYNHDTKEKILYVNGVEDASGISPASSADLKASNQPFEIFVERNEASSAPASADEVGFWNVVLTPKQVAILYNGGAGFPYSSFNDYGGYVKNGLLNRLASYWNLDEGDTGPFVDSHGSNDLTEGGTLTAIAGRINGGIQEAGGAGTNYATITDGTQVGLDITGNLSISAWARADGDQTDFPTIVNKGAGVGNRVYVLAFNGNTGDTNRLNWSTGDASVFHTLVNNTNLADDTWYHVVVTYNTTTKEKRIYINGELDGVGTATHGNALVNSTSDFFLCRLDHLATASAPVSIDEVGIWNTVLTSTQVKQLYNGGDAFPYSQFDNYKRTAFAACF